MIEYTLIEYTVSALLQYLGKKLIVSPKDRAPVDFLFTDEGKTIAVEVKSGKIQTSLLKKILERVKDKKKQIDTFILITSHPPTKKALNEAQSSAKDIIPDFQWYGFEEYTKKLTGVSIKSPQDVAKMQLAAITSNINLYNVTTIGLEPDKKSRAKELIDLINSIDKGEKFVDSEQIALQRQFRYPIVSDFRSSNKTLNKYFNIGGGSRDVTIVLSDIKNFSDIVSSAYPDDLNEVMSKYYREARKLVFEYGGALDKFIGDAVLAIFNYRKKENSSAANVIKFSINLNLENQFLKNYNKTWIN